MSYSDLRDFLAQLEAKGELKRIAAPVSPRLEMTEICDRVLRAGGPALLAQQAATCIVTRRDVLGGGVQRPEENPLDRPGTVGSQFGRPAQLARIGPGIVALRVPLHIRPEEAAWGPRSSC